MVVATPACHIWSAPQSAKVSVSPLPKEFVSFWRNPALLKVWDKMARPFTKAHSVQYSSAFQSQNLYWLNRLSQWKRRRRTLTGMHESNTSYFQSCALIREVVHLFRTLNKSCALYCLAKSQGDIAGMFYHHRLFLFCVDVKTKRIYWSPTESRRHEWNGWLHGGFPVSTTLRHIERDIDSKRTKNEKIRNEMNEERGSKPKEKR